MKKLVVLDKVNRQPKVKWRLQCENSIWTISIIEL